MIDVEPGAGAASAFGALCERLSIPSAERVTLHALLASWWRDSGAPALLELEADYRHWQVFSRSRLGDAAAARDFERHWREAARTFLGRGFSAGEVDELVARFFARVYEKAQDFAFRTPFQVFLRTVLVNLARDEVRRLVRTRRRQVPLDGEGEGERRSAEAACADPSPEAVLLEREREQLLIAALEELAPLDRHVVRAVLLEGRPGQEVAAALGIKRDALYQRLHRAKERLRARLVPAFGSDPGSSRVSPEKPRPLATRRAASLSRRQEGPR